MDGTTVSHLLKQNLNLQKEEEEEQKAAKFQADLNAVLPSPWARGTVASGAQERRTCGGGQRREEGESCRNLLSVAPRRGNLQFFLRAPRLWQFIRQYMVLMREFTDFLCEGVPGF